MVKRFIDLIGSRKFAIWLLVLTTAVILLSNLLPKPYILSVAETQELKRESPVLYLLSQRFNVERVAKSPYFIGITLFLFASITVCTARRVKGRLDAMQAGAVPDVSALPISLSVDVHERGGLQGDLRRILTGRKWKDAGRSAGEEAPLYFRRGENGIWGSVAFHIGMCIVLTGALLSAVTRYNGRLMLTEDFDIEPPRLLKGLKRNDVDLFPVRTMTLADFQPVYQGLFPVDYRADLVIEDIYGRVYDKRVQVNSPLSIGGYQFLLSRYGFAPRFVVRDRAGNLVSDDVVSLAVITPDKVDTFRLMEGLATAKVRFFPDFLIDPEKGGPSSRSRDPNNPVFLVTIDWLGKEKTGGFLKMGGSLEFYGYTIEFKELRYWATLDVSRDKGVPMITLGFLLIILGLTVRLLLNEKALWIIMSDKQVGIGGRARFFPALFDEELRSIAEEMRQGLGDRRREGGK